MNEEKRVCENCSHRSVCVVRKAIRKFIDETFPVHGERPFDPDNIAQICTYTGGVLQMGPIIETLEAEQ